MTNEDFEHYCKVFLPFADNLVALFVNKRKQYRHLKDALQGEAHATLVHVLRSCQRRKFQPKCWSAYLRFSINNALCAYAQSEQLQIDLSYPVEASEQSEYDHAKPIEPTATAPAVEQTYMEHVLSVCPDDRHRRMVTLSLCNYSSRQIADDLKVSIKTLSRMRKRLLTLLTTEERKS